MPLLEVYPLSGFNAVEVKLALWSSVTAAPEWCGLGRFAHTFLPVASGEADISGSE